MGTVHKFKRPPKNTGQFKGSQRPPGKPPRGPRRGWGVAEFVVLAVIAGGVWLFR